MVFRCPGECGWSGFNTAFKSYWRRDKAEDGGLLEQPSQPSPPGSAEAAGWKMICVMPGLQVGWYAVDSTIKNCRSLCVHHRTL